MIYWTNEIHNHNQSGKIGKSNLSYRPTTTTTKDMDNLTMNNETRDSNHMLCLMVHEFNSVDLHSLVLRTMYDVFDLVSIQKFFSPFQFVGHWLIYKPRYKILPNNNEWTTDYYISLQTSSFSFVHFTKFLAHDIEKWLSFQFITFEIQLLWKFSLSSFFFCVHRVRPLSEKERRGMDASVVSFPGNGQILVCIPFIRFNPEMAATNSNLNVLFFLSSFKSSWN